MERENIINELEERLKTILTRNDVAQIKSLYLGKDGIITNMSSKMKELPNEEKREYGKFLNEIKNEVSEKIEIINKEIEERELKERLERDKIDITLPGKKVKRGSLHPLTRIEEEFEDLFVSMGYTVYSGPEIESDENCARRELSAPDSADSQQFCQCHLVRDGLLKMRRKDVEQLAVSGFCVSLRRTV